MPRITCGACGETHTSVEQVRQCFKTRPDAHRDEREANPGLPDPSAAESWGAPKPVVQWTEGIYKKDVTVYKVLISKSGYPYAKQLTPPRGDDGEFLSEGSTYQWEWIFKPGAIKNLSPEDKITKEDAQQYGRITGVCCMCGRKLTNEESIRDGIGPICGGKW